MHRRVSKILLIVFTVFFIQVSFSPSVSSQEFENSVSISLTVYAPETYLPRGEVRYIVELGLDLSVVVPGDVDYYWISVGMPLGSELVGAQGVPFGGAVSQVYDSHTRPQIYIRLPPEFVEESLGLTYTVNGMSTLWRTLIAVTNEMFMVKTNIPETEVVWDVNIILPEDAVLMPEYPKAWPEIPLTIEKGGSTKIRAEPTIGYITVGYEPPFMEVYALFAIVAVCAVSYFIVKYFVERRAEMEVLMGRVFGLAKRLFNLRVMMAGFLAASALVLTVGAVAGFRPDLRVVVMGNPTTSRQMAGELESIPNVRAYTIDETGSLEYITLVRGVDVVVIADLPALSELKRYQLRTMVSSQLNHFVNSGGRVVVISEYMADNPITSEGFGNIFYSAHQESAYVEAVDDVYQLGILLRGEAEVMASNSLYWSAVSFQAVLVTLIAFFGAGFMTSYILEQSSKANRLNALASVAMGGFFVFGLAQLTVIWGGRSMGVPLATHYGAFGLTAYSELSPVFGGGNVLRAAAALFGILAALMASAKLVGGISWKTLLALAAVLTVIALNPLTSGVIFTEATQVFLSGETFYLRPEAPVLRLDSILSEFLFKTASTLGIPFTHALPYISRGVALWFAATILLVVASWVKRPIRTLLLLFSALYIARGIARIGDMNAIAFMGSAVPGITLGLTLIILFVGADKIYTMVRERWVWT